MRTVQKYLVSPFCSKEGGWACPLGRCFFSACVGFHVWHHPHLDLGQEIYYTTCLNHVKCSLFRRPLDVIFDRPCVRFLHHRNRTTFSTHWPKFWPSYAAERRFHPSSRLWLLIFSGYHGKMPRDGYNIFKEPLNTHILSESISIDRWPDSIEAQFVATCPHRQAEGMTIDFLSSVYILYHTYALVKHLSSK